MVFDSKQYVPLIYRGSRDYESLLKLLDIILTVNKYDIDFLINLYIPEKCYSDFLPLLAEHIGYEYNFTDTISENRIIIDNFCKMIRNRGSVTGIKLATALSLNSMEGYFGTETNGVVNDLADLDVFFNYETGQIIIYYSNESDKVRNLIDWVRPVGMYCESLPSVFVDGKRVSADLNISANAHITVLPYDKDIFSKVESSEIYNGMVSKETIITDPYIWKDCLSYTWEGLSNYTWEHFLSGTDVSRTITITFEAEGGTFTTSNVIESFTGYTVTALSNLDVIKGIDQLEKWVDTNSGKEYQPGQSFVVDVPYNITLKAVWKVLQQNSFVIDLDSLSTIPNSINNIQSMFHYTKSHILVEYMNSNNLGWSTESIIDLGASNPASPITRNYPIQHNSGKLRITIGYDSIDKDNVLLNLNSFDNSINTLYSLSSQIDYSGLTDLDYDIFENYPNLEFINGNSNLVTVRLFPNIPQLTIPKYFISFCSNLQYLTFPKVTCNFIFNKVGSDYTFVNFLVEAGHNVCHDGDFEVPSNLTFVITDWISDPSDPITVFNDLAIAKNMYFNMTVVSSNILAPVPKIGFIFGHSNIQKLYFNGKFDLSFIITSHPVTDIIIGSNCSLNYYNGSDLSSCASESLIIDTDDNGATTTLSNYMINGGNISSLSLGNAISSIGDWTVSSLPNITSIEIPTQLTYIPKTAFQNNNKLYSITFNATGITIQGFHLLRDLTTITIPYCDSIGTCFYNCSNLTTINLNNVNNFDYETSFVECSGITNIIDNSTTYSVIDNILYNSSNDFLLWVPWSKPIVEIPTGVKYIGEYSFSGCPKSKLAPYVVNGENIIATDIYHQYDRVVIPETVTTIYNNAFNLTNIARLIILNSDLDLSNLTNCNILEIVGYINSTAHIYANTNNITFIPIDDIENNVNANITDILGTNIL